VVVRLHGGDAASGDHRAAIPRNAGRGLAALTLHHAVAATCSGLRADGGAGARLRRDLTAAGARPAAEPAAAGSRA